MPDTASTQRLAVIALGGNALLRRDAPATAANQLRTSLPNGSIPGFGLQRPKSLA